ncbi:phosphoribosylformyl-glycineamide synthetase, partial [Klebsiella pneumoniae]
MCGILLNNAPVGNLFAMVVTFIDKQHQ